MRNKLYFLCGLLLLSVLSFGQDEAYYEPFALPAPPEDLVSPQIHADHRVTFRLYAPDALEVSLNSDCFGVDIDLTPFGTSTGSVVMSKDSDGIWSYTTKYPVQPNCYTYDYLVDFVHNVVDPANKHDAWNQGSHFSVFAIGGDSLADLYVENAVAHGAVHRLDYYSDMLKQNRRVAVYLPPEYDERIAYPVLYLLHGISGDEMAWLSLGRVAQICDNMISRRQIEPMIIVMPNCNPVVHSVEDGVTTLTDNILNIPRQLSGVFEESFVELTSLIEKRYSVSKLKRNHAIAGISSGGFQASNIVKLYEDYFGCVGLFSATLWKRNVPSVIAPADAHIYYIRMGANDWVSWSLSMHFADRVCRKGYVVDIKETPGGHTWKWWRSYLVEFLPVVFNHDFVRRK